MSIQYINNDILRVRQKNVVEKLLSFLELFKMFFDGKPANNQIEI